MDEVLELLRAKPTKERMEGVERLQQVVVGGKSLSATDVANMVDASLLLLKDNNFRVCQGTLQALASAAVASSSSVNADHLKLHLNPLLPPIVERLGDGKQPVRDAARRLLLALMQISSPTIIVEKAGGHAWAHKNWRVKEEFARTVASAISLFAVTELPFQRSLLPSVLRLLEDSNSNARDAAMVCLEEMYREGGVQLHSELQQHSVRPTQLKEILSRFEKIEPKLVPFYDNVENQFGADSKVHPHLGNRRSTPKTKTFSSDSNSHGGEGDTSDKPVEPVRVCSEKELTKEIENISAMLSSEQEWPVRMAAMQRIEGLIAGGASEYACFPSHLKQLVGPLNLQLADRRSSIVKQSCHLLNLLSEELLGDFEQCAKAFIPALLKLVVITVSVIAESSDNCIKTLLRNCRVACIVPRIITMAKSDRSCVLRAKCCDYALLVLEQWSDSPEIQKLVDIYEDLIKSCVADAISEVRSSARVCYRVFSKCWPDRARRLFASFDSVIQKLLLNEEDGSIHKRYTSPSLRDRGAQQQRHSTSATAGAQSASAGSQLVSLRSAPIVPMEKTGSILTTQKEPSGRILESVLQASQQQVNAIETILEGMDMLEKNDLLSCRSNGKEQASRSYRRIHASTNASQVSVDPPSARDPPFPASTPMIQQVDIRNSFTANTSYLRGIQAGNPVPPSASNIAAIQTSTADIVRSTFSNGNPTASILPLHSAKWMPTNSDAYYNENCHNSMPGFQRSSFRNTTSTRSSSRNSLEEAQLPFGDAYNYMDGLLSMNDALSEGSSPNADWSVRVSTFSYLKRLLQQGPRGVQDILQNFEKIMKHFSMHLDDPHHKVAQAALTTLAEVVPACCKHFECYLERIAPHIFSRLVDPKESIRKLATVALETVGNLYSIDSLLPALLRSIDEQRSPKAKIAVIEFAVATFAKLAINGEAAVGNNLLKMWLAKLAPLTNDKNAKLKETAVNGIISVYTHFDSSTVLNFILGLTIEEQSSLRRALKQYTPRIEVDLMNFLQTRSQRSRSKMNHDQFDASPTSDDNYGLTLASKNPSAIQNQPRGSYSSSFGNEGIRKWSSVTLGESAQYGVVTDLHESTMPARSKNNRNGPDLSPEGRLGEPSTMAHKSIEAKQEYGNATLTQVIAQHHPKNICPGATAQQGKKMNEQTLENGFQQKSSKNLSSEDIAASIPAWLDQLSSGSDEKAVGKKWSALQEFLRLSKANAASIWTQFLNQILTGLIEAIDDVDPSVRELALLTVLEMLGNQKDMLEDSVEVMLEKLLHSSRDLVTKVAATAERCLSLVLSQYDPYRCLSVVTPLMNSEDEKTLVTCIRCLTKLAGRLPSKDLMEQLPSFLPALFDAFGNQNADVRKTVVFCLVDIYIVLGKAFLPYLGRLSSTQLRLVTIYANRISKARSGAPLDA